MENFLTLHFWSGPILGAIIGLITNGIAIRMLFRPLHPVKIGNFQLPFTPGLIPKEQGRIAKSVGKVVSEELFNADVLRKGLITDEIDNKIRELIERTARKLDSDQQSLQSKIESFVGEAKFQDEKDYLEKQLAAYLYKKAVTMNLGETAVNLLMKEMLSSPDFAPLLRFVSGNLIDSIKAKIQDTINQVIEKNAYALLLNAVREQNDILMDRSVHSYYALVSSHLPQFKTFVINQYHQVVEKYLPQVLADIHMDRLVEQQINSYSPAMLEKLLLDLMKKELSAIVYLGGLLGFIMGFIMNFI